MCTYIHMCKCMFMWFYCILLSTLGCLNDITHSTVNLNKLIPSYIFNVPYFKNSAINHNCFKIEREDLLPDLHSNVLRKL